MHRALPREVWALTLHEFVDGEDLGACLLVCKAWHDEVLRRKVDESALLVHVLVVQWVALLQPVPFSCEEASRVPLAFKDGINRVGPLLEQVLRAAVVAAIARSLPAQFVRTVFLGGDCTARSEWCCEEEAATAANIAAAVVATYHTPPHAVIVQDKLPCPAGPPAADAQLCAPRRWAPTKGRRRRTPEEVFRLVANEGRALRPEFLQDMLQGMPPGADDPVVSVLPADDCAGTRLRADLNGARAVVVFNALRDPGELRAAWTRRQTPRPLVIELAVAEAQGACPFAG